MAVIENPATQFANLKKADPLLHENPTSVQEAIEIRRVSPGGMFEIGEDKYSKTFDMSDINYSNKSYEEQVIFFDAWTNMINSFGKSYEITAYNKPRSKRNFENNVLYKLQGDEYDDARECYNDLMRGKIIDDKQGIEQKKYLTIILDKKGGVKEAEKAMASFEASATKEYAAFGSHLSPLSGNQRLTLLRDFYLGEDVEECSIEKCIANGRDWRNEICPPDISWSPAQKYAEINGKFCRAMYIDPHSYEDSIEDKFFRALSDLSFESLVTLHVVPIPKKVTQKVLEAKYMGIEEMIRKQQQKRNKNKDFASEISYKLQREKEEIVDMLDAVRKRGQKQFWVGVTIVVCANSLEELDLHTSTVEQICSGSGCNCRLNVYYQQQREGINTALPLGVRNSSFMRAMFTQSVAAFIPFHVMELYDDTMHPFFYGVNKDSKNPVLFSRLNLLNPNGFVFGMSGSGKSMTGSKLEIGSVFLTTDDDIIIIDPQLEYPDQCSSFNGSYINFATYSKNYINMFHCDLDKLEDNYDEICKDKSELAIGNIESLLDDEMSPGIKTIIERCVRAMYSKVLKLPKEKRYIPIMSNFYDEAVRQLENEREKQSLVSREAAEQLVLGAERFISGSLEIFNHQSNVDMNNRLTVFGIKDLPKSVWGNAMSNIMSFITQKVQQNYAIGKRTRIFMDEFHYLTKTRFTKEYTIEAWKTFRKFNAVLTGITQNAIDLLKDPDTTTMVSNSQYTFFLKQDTNDVDVILSAFKNISEAQIQFITSAPAGTGILRFGDVVISIDARIDKDNPIYDVFNTNPNEKAQKMQKQLT